ncbi:uncharacterized protein LOC128554261 [Mercenaria mercenaria]|uniref:uncharacterized protein LOC128554261 n=1 Tax=Mercenaria mercenaria TaxID=6596 RepID=UPI00234EFCCF|nr:uncharacterized protein LOC128554261 [Mercenaria mercenaria]
MAGIPTFPKFDVHEHSVGARWNKYVAKLENIFVGMKIDTNKRKKALLLHYAGDDVYDIYETLTLSASEDNYTDTKTKLKAYFEPKKNREFERFEFRNIKQTSDESIDQFCTRLRQKSELCEFSNKDDEIKSQIIQGCTSKTLRTKCLEEERSLQDILILGRSMEIARKHASEMEKSTHQDGIQRIKTKQSQQKQQQQPMRVPARQQQRHPRPKQRRQFQNPNTCRNCGGKYPHQGQCPAYGRTCNYCHKKNHLLSVCYKRIQQNSRRSRQLHEIEENDSENSDNFESSDSEVTYGMREEIRSVKSKNVPRINVKISGIDHKHQSDTGACGIDTKVLIDTGSSINIISQLVIDKMSPTPKLEKSEIKDYPFGQKQPIHVEGKYKLTVESNSKFVLADFQSIKGNSENIISYETAVELGIVPVINSMRNSDYKELCEKYNQLFNGLGKLKDVEVKFHVDESVVPSTQPPRRVPFHVREKVEKELQRLEDLDVIEKVDGPTPWVSNLVITSKPHAPEKIIRICVDMRHAIKAIKRERHVTPTIDDILMALNGSTVFSRVDLLKGFHQIPLSQESRNMTTFATHVGLRRYKCLNFGVNAAPEIFQNEIRQALSGLKGVMNISDDIIFRSKTREEHDRNLEALFQRLTEKNITLNKNRCEFGQSKIAVYGYVFSDQGISPDPKKVEALKKTE